MSSDVSTRIADVGNDSRHSETPSYRNLRGHPTYPKHNT
jgi:hypothetical protein